MPLLLVRRHHQVDRGRVEARTRFGEEGKMTSTERNFVEGKGQYVGDMRRPGMLHLKIVRSIYARAKLLGVQGGITGAELKALLTSTGEGAVAGGGVVPYPVLAHDRVNYVGQPIAGVLGKTEAGAEDLLHSVQVEYGPLKPIVDPEAALRAEPIHPGTSTNVFAEARLGRTFAEPKGSLVVEDTLVNERVIPNPLETRGVLVEWDGSRLIVYGSTQSVHGFQEGFRESLHLGREAVRVVQMDTGGAFGSKGGVYPEYIVAGYAAMKLRRPVRWIETRTEHLQATEQGRGSRAHMILYADRLGKVRGLKADLLIDGGGYSAGMGEFSAPWIGSQLAGPYAIPRARVEGRAVYTNKVPLGPYRGAGRPEAAFFIERMMDLLADELKMDPVDVRLHNASANAHTSPLGVRIPPLKPFLRAAAKELGYPKLARKHNVGFSTFILIPAARPGESGRIAVREGRVKVWVGGNSQGQGHETFVKMLVHKELGAREELVDLEKSDTAVLHRGIGAWGSRSAMVVGGAVVEAARKVRDQVRRTRGRYSVKILLEGSYDAEVFFSPKGNYNSLGANLVVADLQPTGLVRVRESRAYYDVGKVLNPAMLESQVAGGSLQGIGQVLYESVAYDEDGQLLTASLADAGLPTATEAPTKFLLKTPRTRSDLPHGAKGVGESPAIGVPPALVRAIERQVGRRLRTTPLRPENLIAR